VLTDSLVHLPGLLERRRVIGPNALIFVGAVVAFDEAILVGALGRTDLGLDVQAGQEAHKCGREIGVAGTPDETRVTVEGDLARAANLL
jgi:hypothetical protein